MVSRGELDDCDLQVTVYSFAGPEVPLARVEVVDGVASLTGAADMWASLSGVYLYSTDREPAYGVVVVDPSMGKRRRSSSMRPSRQPRSWWASFRMAAALSAKAASSAQESACPSASTRHIVPADGFRRGARNLR